MTHVRVQTPFGATIVYEVVGRTPNGDLVLKSTDGKYTARVPPSRVVPT